MASFFLPLIALRKDDLPTLERPQTIISVNRSVGIC
jgi:hypothetical protein